jgi:hypothetical protein
MAYFRKLDEARNSHYNNDSCLRNGFDDENSNSVMEMNCIKNTTNLNE